MGKDKACEYVGVICAHRKNKIKFLFKVVDALRGGYNDEGVKNWFFRKRKTLEGKSPDDILSNEWMPKDELPQKILSLAKSLHDGNAT
ncbi:MAG: hypothetical protein V1661_03255 [bacterium]